MLWLFLPALERWWGMKRFLFFAAYVSIPAVAVGTLVGYWIGGATAVKIGGVAIAGTPVNGLDPFIFAGIAAYGVLFSKRKVQFFGVLPMTGKQLAIGITLFTLAFILIGQAWAEGAAMATAMIIAVAVTTGKLAPRLWWLKWRQKRVRRHLKVVNPADEKKKKKYVN
jgi:membrane associated rhomboid family serine protease